MKKSLIIIATAALVFAGCTENDTFRKDINGNGANNGAITFNSYTEKATKAENSDAYYTQKFFTHQESFQVWARKSNQPTQEIFDGTKVKVEEGTTANTYTYTYAPERFWDKLAEKYHFYAAAPARPESETEWMWKFNDDGINDDASINAGYFSIDKDFTLNEVNLKHKDNGGADNKLENVFKGIKVSNANTDTDVDLLIAAPTEVTNSYYNVANPSAVNLNFIHILSKLNVTIKTTLGTVRPTDGPADGSKDHTYQVKLLAFEVKNVPNVGTYKEDPNIIPANNKKQIRWTLSTPTAPATNKTSILTGIEGLDSQNKIKTDALSVPYNPTEAQKLYIVESLFIPQDIKYERVALDGKAHDAVDNSPVPFASYEAYEAARHNDVDRLTQAQFDALFATKYTTFIADFNNYKQVSENIDQATFNERVAEATNNNNTPDDLTDDAPYADYTTYTAAKGNDATLNEAQFAALLTNGAFKTWDDYTQVALENIDEDEFKDRIADATETDLPDIPAYSVPSEPYFTIKYSIDNEIFEANYNLAAAFLGYNNNSQKWDTNGNLIDLVTTGENADPTTFDFYEGWQNTLNIIINPKAIQFTADVAEWSDNKTVDYVIENGNE